MIFHLSFQLAVRVRFRSVFYILVQRVSLDLFGYLVSYPYVYEYVFISIAKNVFHFKSTRNSLSNLTVRVGHQCHCSCFFFSIFFSFLSGRSNLLVEQNTQHNTTIATNTQLHSLTI